jgi:hypothetical protein
MRRYGWGRPRGTRTSRIGSSPPPVMTHPDRWRLDQLLAWEERRMAPAEAPLRALGNPDRDSTAVTDLLPEPKRRRRGA